MGDFINFKKWIVVNIEAPGDASSIADFLVKIYDKIVLKYRNRVDSWHFLWRDEPYPRTLLVRFYGESSVVDELKNFSERELKVLKCNFCFGAHGECSGDYRGEAEEYGSRGWDYIMRLLNLGSELAIDIIKRRGKEDEEFKLTKGVAVERWIHLFCNQINVNEPFVLFSLASHRYIVDSIEDEKKYYLVSGMLQRLFKELYKEYCKFLDSIVESIKQSET
ncbi:MAG: hypothetical protein J7K82_08600 [Thermoproteales archaeon]|nr:hypothetical protein [Thermoproteales archaeon]